MINDELAKYLACFNATAECLKLHMDIILPVQAFSEAKVKFEGMLTAYGKKIEDRDTVHEGKVQLKEARRNDLVQMDITLLSALGTLASKTKDVELAEFAKGTPESKLIKMRPVNLISRSNEIQAKAVAKQTSLVGHGVTEEQISGHLALIDAFKEAAAQVDSTSGTKTAETEELEIDCRAIKKLLREEMDGYVKTIRQANPEFYNEYQHVREVKNYGIRHEKTEEPPVPPPPEPPVNP